MKAKSSIWTNAKSKFVILPSDKTKMCSDTCPYKKFLTTEGKIKDKADKNYRTADSGHSYCTVFQQKLERVSAGSDFTYPAENCGEEVVEANKNQLW